MKRLAFFPNNRGAFRYRNFQLYFGAQLLSLMGTFMQSIALGYLVYDLTGSKWLLGVISGLQLGPSLFLSLPAGVLADRVPRKRLVLTTQSAALLLAFTLATLTALHRLQIWEILVISSISGLAIATESPARQAFISELVGPRDLPNAIAWNSLVLNGSRVLGPAVGGIVIRFIGVAPIFYFNSFSFLAVIVALLLMRLPVLVPQSRHPLEALREGLAYVRHSPAIMLTLAMTAMVATFIMNFAVLMPIMARDVMHTRADGLGWMWTAFGLGAVAGSITVVVRSRAAASGTLVLIAALAAGAATIALSFMTTLSSALPALALIGWGTGAFFTSANSAIQNRATDAVRGRVMSVFTMINAGSAPLGGLFAAGVASAGGVQLTLGVEGSVTLLLSVVLAVPFLRHLRKGTSRPVESEPIAS